MEELEVRADLSPSMHPSSCPGQDPDSALARGALHGLYSCAGKLNDLAKTQIDRELLGTTAEPVAELAVKKAGETLVRLDELSEALSSKIAREIVSTPFPPAVGVELRQHFKEMKKGRMGEFHRLLENPTPENRQILTEILKYPAILSGFSAKAHAAMKVQAELVLCPQDCARRKNIDLVRGRLDVATDVFSENVAKQLKSMRPVGRAALTKAFGGVKK